MFYKYKVTYFNDSKDEEVPSEGIVWGDNYSDAANRVVEDYGNDNLIDIYLYEICIDGIYCIDKDELDYALKRE